MNNKKKHKQPKKLSGERSPEEVKAHQELVHEDKDPIYPIDPIQKRDDPRKRRKI